MRYQRLVNFTFEDGGSFSMTNLERKDLPTSTLSREQQQTRIGRVKLLQEGMMIKYPFAGSNARLVGSSKHAS